MRTLKQSRTRLIEHEAIGNMFKMFGASDAAQAMKVMRPCEQQYSGSSYGAAMEFLSAPRNRRRHQQRHGSEARQNAELLLCVRWTALSLGSVAEEERKGRPERRIFVHKILKRSVPHHGAKFCLPPKNPKLTSGSTKPP